MKKRSGQVVRVLRRSTALALAATAAWAALRTAGLPDPQQVAHILSQDAVFAISLLRSQLPNATREGPPGWQRLALSQSPLLSSLPHALPLTQPPDTLSEDYSAPPDEDLSEPSIPQTNADNPSIIPRTMAPSATQTYLQTGDIYIADRADKQPDVATLASARVRLTLANGPQILILHSHGSEAYPPADGDIYTESDPYRTTDCNYNVVRVGEEMAQVFRSAGFGVIHDTTLYDHPSYNEAYDRSLAATERWLNQYPSIQVILDVHRDALVSEDGTIYKAISPQKGTHAAQVMLVVGTDGTGKHPLWQENLTFAMRLQQQLLDDHGTLARPMVLRASRFNQHLSVGSVLVEVGTHGNTLQEALQGAKLFAQSTAAVLNKLN